jgi:hypothetical protein
VLDRSRIELGFDDRLADAPQLLGLSAAFGNDAIGDETLFQRAFEKPLQ